MKFLKACLAWIQVSGQRLLKACLPPVKAFFAGLPGKIRSCCQQLRKKPALAVNVGVLAFCALLALALLLTQPAEPEDAESVSLDYQVGVCLSGPAESTLSRLLTQELEAQGFRVNLLCADGDPSVQQGQLRTLLVTNINCLIVQPVDSHALTQTLATAKEKGIPVIACDDLLMDSDWVWGYVGFDYYTLGKLMARKLVENKALDDENGRSYTIELFMDAPEKRSSYLLYQGAMEILDPYLRSGKLKTRSGRTYFEDTYTAGSTASARSQCTLRLRSGRPDIILAGNDEIAEGCRQALTEEGYEKEAFPTIIGQGGNGAAAVKEGTQLATYAKAPIALAEACAEAAALALSGEELATEITHNNRVLDVPTKLLPTSLVE